jgi:hypothetical protein
MTLKWWGSNIWFLLYWKIYLSVINEQSIWKWPQIDSRATCLYQVRLIGVKETHFKQETDSVCWNSTRFLVGWVVATVTSIQIWNLVLQPAAGHTRPTYTVCFLLYVQVPLPNMNWMLDDNGWQNRLELTWKTRIGIDLKNELELELTWKTWIIIVFVIESRSSVIGIDMKKHELELKRNTWIGIGIKNYYLAHVDFFSAKIIFSFSTNSIWPRSDQRASIRDVGRKNYVEVH